KEALHFTGRHCGFPTSGAVGSFAGVGPTGSGTQADAIPRWNWQPTPVISSQVRPRQTGLCMRYPDALDPSLVGTHPASAHAGGGYVWDAVLEYRVWCHPERGAPDLAQGSDYYYPFATYREALDFSESNDGTEEPLALVLQEEFIDEPEAG